MCQPPSSARWFSFPLLCVTLLITSTSDEPVEWQEYKLELGQLAKEDEETFCPWQTIKKYPYTYIGKTNSENVDKKFFAGGRCEQRTWDL